MTDDTDGKPLVLSLTVITAVHADALKAYEVLGRAAVGLALEGIQVGTNITTIDIEEEQEQEEPG